MLTRDDLERIRDILKDEIRIIVREEVKAEVFTQLKPINRKLNRLQKDITFIVHDYSNAIAGLREKIEKN